MEYLDVLKKDTNLFDKIASGYPFGQIDLPPRPGTHSKPSIANGAIGKIATANSAEILFADGVALRSGENKFTADGEGSLIVVGAGTTFQSALIQINGKGCKVIIGNNCRLRGLTIKVQGANSTVIIGSRTTWESGAILSESGNVIAIGNDCMMSNGVVLRTTDGHTIFDAASKKPINNSADLFIGHHVWLGNSSRVNKGTKIGSGTVVGQCAIASGELEANSVYAGVPARLVRSKIVWSRTQNYSDIPREFIDEKP